MSCNIRVLSTIFLSLIVLTVATFAWAQVDLRWSPSDTTVISAIGETGRLSVYIDEVLDLRTVEITVTYDTTMVKSLGGGPGTLYSESGYFVFQGFEEEPGSWHGFAIIMGAGEYITGPGELLYWNVEGLIEGVSSVVVEEAILYDEASPPNQISDVNFGNGTIIVGDPLSAVLDAPGAGIGLHVAPNPFNPRTRISFAVEQETSAQLSVFDARGHKIAVLFDGLVQDGLLAVDWSGTDDSDRSQPGGVYFFLLETKMGNAWSKGILIK